MPVVVKYKCNRNSMKTLIGVARETHTCETYVQMENNIKINNRGIAYENVDWMPLAKNSAQRRAL